MERADDDGQYDHGTDGQSRSDDDSGSSRPVDDDGNKSIASHAAEHHPHDGHDGTQDDPHSQPTHGGTHHNMAARHARK